MAILSLFLTDYTKEELFECADAAYSQTKFGVEPVPLRKVNENTDVLELWHWPTSAFKDMALQILPHLLTKAIGKTGESNKVVILVATSGDTGKAALEGFANVKDTEIIVFYPEDGVSAIQKRQMLTQTGDNVRVIGIKGNFDDAQRGVKELFGDTALEEELQSKGYVFSSANSINWGRLVPQIVYYFSAYSDAVANGRIKAGEKINFAVPTGNFGDILAGYYAKQMGLPVGKLVCASNQNNVLTLVPAVFQPPAEGQLLRPEIQAEAGELFAGLVQILAPLHVEVLQPELLAVPAEDQVEVAGLVAAQQQGHVAEGVDALPVDGQDAVAHLKAGGGFQRAAVGEAVDHRDVDGLPFVHYYQLQRI